MVSEKEIYRKMAPLYMEMKHFNNAIDCLKKVIEQEDQEVLKVNLLTKITGYYKKADLYELCLQASQDAYELIKRLRGTDDAQTWRCFLNIANVYQYFERTEEAKSRYQEFLNTFENYTINGEGGDWSQMGQFVKLRDIAQDALDEMEGGEGDGYYDEEADEGEEDQQ